MALQFDPNLPGLIEGNITSVIVLDPENVPNHVLDPTKPFDVEVTWSFSGSIFPVWLTALGGNFVVSVYAESVGDGPELLVASNSSVAALPPHASYSATMTVPANTLQEGNPASNVSGIYKLVVSVFLDSTIGPSCMRFRATSGAMSGQNASSNASREQV